MKKTVEMERKKPSWATPNDLDVFLVSCQFANSDFGSAGAALDDIFDSM